jgi:hypothetical protein
MLLVAGLFLRPFIAQAYTYNPAFKTKRKIASTADASDSDCIKAAEAFARASYSQILGAGKVKEVVWLSAGNPMKDPEGNLGQDHTKQRVEVAVTSTSYKKQGEYDMFDYAVNLTMDLKCNPRTARFYDARSKDYENASLME